MNEDKRQLADAIPDYEADEEELSQTQLDQIKATAPKTQGGAVRSTLFAQNPPTAPSLINHDR